MAYGFESRDASNNVIYSTLDSTWTLLHTATANANQAHTFTGVPVMPTRLVTKLMIDQVNGDDEAFVHGHSLSGTNLTASVPSANNTTATFFMVFGK